MTLGPSGRNVVIDKKWGSPTVTKDGVTVAKEIELDDPFENMGAQMVQGSRVQDLRRRRRRHHDRDRTRRVHLQGRPQERHRRLQPDLPQARHRQGRRGRRRRARAHFEEGQRPRRKSRQVATVSANGDAEIGKIIADAMDKVGKDGTITVEEAKSIETDARRRRGHAVRQGLPLAVLRDRRRQDGGRPRGRLHPDPREEDLEPAGPAARCSRRSRRAASRCSSSPRTSRARRSPRSS